MLCCSRWGSADCGRAAVLSTKGIVSLISISRSPPLFLWRSSRTAVHPGVLSGFDSFVSLVYWIATMLTLLLWRKVSSSVIFPLMPFAFHCIRRRQLVGVETCPGFISISPTHWSRSRSSRASIDRSATKGDLTSRESSEVLAMDSVGRWSGRDEATSIRIRWPWKAQDYSSCIVLYQLQVGCHIMRITKQQWVTVAILDKTKADTSVAIAVLVRNLRINDKRRSSM